MMKEGWLMGEFGLVKEVVESGTVFKQQNTLCRLL